MNIYNLHDTLLYDLLIEERSVHKSYLPIGDELYDNLVRTDPNLIDVGKYSYHLINFIPSEESFMASFNILCYVGVDKPSSFDILEDELHLTKNGKLKNVVFRLFVKADGNNGKIPDKNDFMENFCHEFHHAYRYHCIISKNNGELSDSERSNNNILTNIAKVRSTKGIDGEFARYVDFFTDVVYVINDNESNTYASELYEYLRQHRDINYINFADRVNEIEFYFYPKLVDVLAFIDKNNHNESLRRALLTICTDVLGWNTNERTALMMFRQYLAKKAEKIQAQFFKVGRKALYDLGRYGKRINEEIGLSFLKNKQITEILNKH